MLELKITYKSGFELTQKVNYIHTEDGNLCFTVCKNVHALEVDIVKVPLVNIEKFEAKEI